MSTGAVDSDRILRGSKSSLAAVALFSFFVNLLTLTLPLYMLQLFTHVMSSRSVDTLVLLTIAATFALMFAGVMEIVRARLLARIGLKIDEAIGDDALAASLSQDSRDPTHKNALRDVQELRNFLSGRGVLMLFDIPWVPLYVGIIFILHPALGWLALLGSVALFLLAVLNDSLTRHPLRAGSAVTAGALHEVDGYSRSGEAVRVMGMLPALRARWKRRHWTGLHYTSSATLRIVLLTVIAQYLRRILQILLMAVGTYLVIENDLTSGGMLAASILMGQGLRPVESAISAWRSLVTARSAFRRLKEAVAAGAAARALPMSLPRPRGHLEIQRVTFAPEGSNKPILKGVSLDILPGQVVGIIGPSGAGKTTLARIIVGALRPRTGSVRLDGAEVHTWNQIELGQHIGYLPQDVQLFSGTVRDNIARMAPDAQPEMVIAAAQKADLHELILQLPKGYDTDIGDAGAFLSGGQRQRLALARALYGGPRLLVMDEPNANLDPDGERALVKAIAEAKADGATVVVITHRPSLVSQASTLVVMQDGMVQMLGPVDQVMPKVARPTSRPPASASVHYLDAASAPAVSSPAE